jgi:signal transduction histidine kinase/CheY-like chemotaxis protein
MAASDVAKTQQLPVRGSDGPIGESDSGTANTTNVISSTPDESKWAARLVGAGSLLTLVFEVAYLVFDRHLLLTGHAWPLFLHSINIGLFLIAVVMTLRVGPWMRRHWKAVAFSFSAILIVSSMFLTIVTGEKQPLFIMLTLFLAGTGPFLSWGERTQGLLSLVAIAAFAIADAKLPHQRPDPYQWLGIFIAAAIGLFSTALERRLRRARRQAEDELVKSRELLIAQERIRVAGQLASGIAHDLNNTLNVIKLTLAALTRDETVVSSQGARLQSIKRAVEDATLTVARVRELGRKREEKPVETAQLAEVIAEAIDLARTTIEGNSSLDGVPIRIESHVSGPLPRVHGSASEIRQVLLNLLLNANDAISEQGKITVDSVVRHDAVLVTVSDDGLGIPADNLERIFDPFFTTKGPRGTGLGLSIARNVVESFGGRITASNGQNGGAVFTLEFPVAVKGTADDMDNVVEQMAGGCRFLLVDDDADNLRALRELLQLKGHKVDTARSGAEALEKIRSASIYDVILCDLAMPAMNGWEVARQALEADANLNFYIVTGWGRELQKQAPANLPIRGVMSKPIDPNDLDRIAALVQEQPTRSGRVEDNRLSQYAC